MSIVSLEKVQDKKVKCNDGIMQIEEHIDKKWRECDQRGGSFALLTNMELVLYLAGPKKRCNSKKSKLNNLRTTFISSNIISLN